MESATARKSIRICGRQTTYWEYHSERPNAIIILHGFRGNHHALIPLSRRLNTHRVILPDRPGYGESDPLDKHHTPPNYAHWLDGLIERLGLGDFAVWGHSYGATIALIHAARGNRKPSAAIAVSPAPLSGGMLQSLTTLYYQIGQMMPNSLRRVWLTNSVMERTTGRILLMSTHGKKRDELLSDGIAAVRSARLDVISEEYFSGVHTDLDPYVAGIALPTLFVAGAKDVVAPLSHVRNLASKAQRGTLQILEEQGHLAPIEVPEEIAALTEQFLTIV